MKPRKVIALMVTTKSEHFLRYFKEMEHVDGQKGIYGPELDLRNTLDHKAKN
jgi:hypothetical protein